ncbi:hypothetical protein FKW78_25840 [Mycolicibacterium fortuitum]|nr:hypothetical protein FKW78_25840 [Mycolicibacterium fortuitum]
MSTAAHAAAGPAVPIGMVARVVNAGAGAAVWSPTVVSDTVSSSASSSAASAPTLRARAAAASASVTTSTFGTPASSTVWRSVSAAESSGRHSRVAATWLPDSVTAR